MQYGMADFEGALAKLKQADKMEVGPALRAQIRIYLGAAYLDLGQVKKARRFLRSALDYDPAVELPEDFKTAQKKLFHKIKSRLRGTLAVTASGVAKVRVDNKVLGRTPFRCKLPIGSHRVAVQGPQGAWITEEVLLIPGRVATVRASVEPLRSVRGEQPAAVLGDRPLTVDRTPTSKQGGVWTWILAGSAAALGGAGRGLWLSADADHGEWTRLQDPPQQPVKDAQRLEELEDSIRTKETASWALFGVAGGLAVTAVALFFIEAQPLMRQGGRPTALIPLGAAGINIFTGDSVGVGFTTPF